MILNAGQSTNGHRATLDELFRRAGVRHPDALALTDPPNSERITGRPPRKLTYAEADRAVAAFAGRLRGFGPQTDTVVAIQMANTVDSIVALLGVLRAGMIAAPLPQLWRVQDMVSALALVGAKAIITCSRIGAHAPAESAVRVAAELFPIRWIGGFGPDLPDGVAPLDDCIDGTVADFFQPSTRPGLAASHVAVVTVDVTSDGLVPLARSHRELIAGGLAAFPEGVPIDANILSTIPIGSFAGIALSVIPWLVGGGTFALHHGFDAAVFAEQMRAQQPSIVVLPGPALLPLADAGLIGSPRQTILGLWRAPERLAGAPPWRHEAALVDIASFGEIGLLPARRGTDGLSAPIPLGAIRPPRGGPNAEVVLETAPGKSGTLLLRGTMVPAPAFPSAAASAPDGFRDTGYSCRIAANGQTLVLTAPPAGITATGYYRFRQADVDAAVAAADPAAVIAALPDAQLGQRLAGHAEDRVAAASELAARGVNALIAGAFRTRSAA